MRRTGGRLEKGLSREVEASCKRQIAWLEREIRKALQDDEKMARRTALHQSVKGVGEATSALVARQRQAVHSRGPGGVPGLV